MKRLKPWERWSLIIILLFAWALRWLALMEVPPGWRDDDLIELYTFSLEIWNNGPALYLAGASGHEPLFHTVRAPLLAVAGLNQASARFQATSFSLIAVLLTWAVGRRLFTREVGILSGALVTVSFWSLMYSRVAIRHIGALPWMLLAIYWGWRTLQDKNPSYWSALGIAIGTAGSVLTYYAGRLIPPMLLIMPFIIGKKEPAGNHPKKLLQYFIGLVVGIALTAPMFWAAARTPGADARITELAVPLREYHWGNVKPLLQTAWTTLGMFHAKGDPEWLYNFSERPVFGWLGALIFYLGIVTRLAHLDQANARVMLIWLGVGITPALISTPPSSYGHTILALPATYILMTMPMKAAARRWSWTAKPLIALTLIIVGARDLPDYFIKWARHPMVEFLYRADYRALVGHLEEHPEIKDVAVGSFLFGPWDKVAVQTDLQRQDVAIRWFNPERATVGTENGLRTYIQDENLRHPQFQTWFNRAPSSTPPEGMQGALLTLPEPPANALRTTLDGTPLASEKFEESLVLQAAIWTSSSTDDMEQTLTLWWNIIAPLPLPPHKLISQPPPPGVYSGPRLKIFTHLLAKDGSLISTDDGLWVDPYSLQKGDRFIQWHRFKLQQDEKTEPVSLEIGLYDPLSGERWHLQDGDDKLLLQIPQ